MRFATGCRTVVALTIIAVGGGACGGDSTGPGAGGQPQPPAGSATKVPRVLGLSTIDGKQLPTMHYTSSTYQSDAWTDSGSATLQDDSLLVLRTYTRWVDHGAGRQAPGTPDMFTTAGRLRSTGIAILPYTDGTADTARVLANGAIEASLSINENGTTKPYGTYLFAAAYSGGAMNPIPYVHVISPDTVAQFSDSAAVTIAGSSLLPTTQASWDRSTLLNVRYVNPYQIVVSIPGQYLQAAGEHSLAVINPAPGGGERIFSFTVGVPEPAIMSLAPASMPVNGGDFTLRVHGRGFTASTRVLWNGSPRTPRLVSTTDLDLALTNADLQTASTVSVAVQTPPSPGVPGGGTSGVIYFTVTPSTAQKLEDVSVSFSAAQLVPDPVRPIVYATADGIETKRPNQVVALDPSTGQIVWSFDLGREILAAAISDDGQYLYLAAASDSVVRLSLATHAVDGSVQLGGSPGTYQAFELAVAPGMPRRVAVLERALPSNMNGAVSLHVFDGSQELGTGIAGTHPEMIRFVTPQTLYGLNPLEAYGSVKTYAVSTSDVTLTATQQAGVGAGCCMMTGLRVYTYTGHVYDLGTHSGADLAGFGSVVGLAPSSDGTQLYVITPQGYYLRAYDIQSQQEVAAVPFDGPGATQWGGWVGMVRWGTDGVAFLDVLTVHFVRASFVH